MGLRGWSDETNCPNKSKEADGGYIEFNKMLISMYWMKMFAFSLVEKCKLGQTMDNNCKTAFSVPCSRERSDDYSFYLINV